MIKYKSIGIMGGTFDPIHYGHLVAANFACEEFNLDRIIFMPSARPPHKDCGHVLDSKSRFEMTRMAIEGNEAFEISALEMERKGYSYTVETIEYYLHNYPGVELFFIMGVDALLLINTWKDINRLSGMCKFIVVSRPDFSIDKNDMCFQGTPALLWDNLHILKIPALAISSTQIRERIQDGKTIKYLLPDSVEQYIIQNNLYR